MRLLACGGGRVPVEPADSLASPRASPMWQPGRGMTKTWISVDEARSDLVFSGLASSRPCVGYLAISTGE